MRDNCGTIYEPYYEWWLHHHPFRKDVFTCPICSSDTGCRNGCPAADIKNKLNEIGDMVRTYIESQRQ